MSQCSFKPGDRVSVTCEGTIRCPTDDNRYVIDSGDGVLWRIKPGNIRPARAVLDEAAKPAPGGPKMRELRITIDHPDVGEYNYAFCTPDLPIGRTVFTALVPEPTVPEVPPRVGGEGE